MSMGKWWSSAEDGRWNILIRASLGFVFILEGYQKLAYPEILGAGRFTKIGIPLADVMGPFVGVTEFLCGALILIGFFARVAAVPLILIMLMALLSTKVPILLGHDWLIFHVRDLDRYGFLSMTHEARTDVAMLLEALFILLCGAGRWSFDATRSGEDRPF